MKHISPSLGLAALLVGCASPPPPDKPVTHAGPIIGLIIKTSTNPYLDKMLEGAQTAATANGARLILATGRSDGDHPSQVKAIDEMLANGARTIMITPSDARAIVPAIRKAQAAGAMVIALDSPTDPVDATDALIASNNYRMGQLAGQYAKAAMAGKTPVIAMLDLFHGHPLGVQRHNGFMVGFGLNANDARSNEQSTAPEIVCSVDSYGDRARSLTAMEDCLRKHPTVNLVYTVNEPAASGAAQALRAAGKAGGTLIVSFDGSCRGIQDVRSGVIAASVAQYPQRMAALGVDAGIEYARTGRKLRGYVDPGVSLVAATSMPGVASRHVSLGAELCWGH